MLLQKLKIVSINTCHYHFHSDTYKTTSTCFHLMTQLCQLYPNMGSLKVAILALMAIYHRFNPNWFVFRSYGLHCSTPKTQKHSVGLILFLHHAQQKCMTAVCSNSNPSKMAQFSFDKRILVGGLEHFLFFHILEIIIPID